jgi:small conductance mechanosensitive channel
MSDKAGEKLMDIVAVLGQAALVFIVGFILIKVILGITRRALSKTNLDESLHTFIENSVKIILWVVTLVAVLAVLGIETTSFVAVLGTVGVAIALALKDSLGNIAGGIIILATKPFKKGDYIDITDAAGVVEKMDLLYTMLKTFDNKVITVPNGKITTAVMTNYSTEELRRVDCQFGISYDDDIVQAKQVLLAVAESNPDILLEPTPIIAVAGHGESSVDFDLKVWCKNEAYWSVKYFLQENVKIAFDVAGISIPYPQMDVHTKK